MSPESSSQDLHKEIWLTRGLGILVWSLAILLISSHLGTVPLVDPDEGRNASVALEMYESGRMLVPTYNGLTYLDKPAFYFRSVAFSIQAFGWSEAAVRLPSVIFGIAVLAMLYLVCRREYSIRLANIALIVLASTPLFFSLARIVIPDMALAVFVCASIFAGFHAESGGSHRRRAWHAASALAAGFATIVKGPIGFLLSAAVLAVYHVVSGRPRAILRMFHPINFVLFFLIVLPWFIGLSLLHPDFPRYGLSVELLSRISSDSLGRSKPFYYFGLNMLGTCFGWSMLYLGGAWMCWRRRSRLKDIDRLFVVWVVTSVLLFSLSKSKMPAYVLTASVALAGLTARLFDHALSWPQSHAAKAVRQGTILFGALCTLIGSGLTVEYFQSGLISGLLVNHRSDPTWMAPLIKSVGVIALGSGLLALIAAKRRSAIASLSAFVALPFCIVLFASGDFATYARWQSSKSIASGLEALSPGSPVVCIESFPPGLAGYLGRSAVVVTKDGSEFRSNYIAYCLQGNKEWPEQVIRPSELDDWLSQQTGETILLAKRKRKLESLAKERGIEMSEVAPGWWVAVLRSRIS